MRSESSAWRAGRPCLLHCHPRRLRTSAAQTHSEHPRTVPKDDGVMHGSGMRSSYLHSVAPPPILCAPARNAPPDETE